MYFNQEATVHSILPAVLKDDALNNEHRKKKIAINFTAIKLTDFVKCSNCMYIAKYHETFDSSSYTYNNLCSYTIDIPVSVLM